MPYYLKKKKIDVTVAMEIFVLLRTIHFVSTGCGVSGNAVPALWLAVHTGWTASYVWLHSLWDTSWSLRA